MGAQKNSQIDPEDLLRERRKEQEAKVRANFCANEDLRKRLKAKELAENMNKKSFDEKKEDKRKAEDAALVHEKRRKLLAKMDAEEDESGGRKGEKSKKGEKSQRGQN